MDTNPYSSPHEVATGDAPRRPLEQPGNTVVLKGIGIGALLGAAAGAAIVVATMWISHPNRVPESLADKLTEIGAIIFYATFSSFVGAVLGVIGFGVVAAARQIRRRRSQ